MLPTRSVSTPLTGKWKDFKVWSRIFLALILVSAFAIRVYYFSCHTVYTTDSYYYLTLAKSLRSGTGYAVRGIAHNKYFPLYPLLIAFFSIFLRNYEWTAGILAALGGVISILFVYLLGKELMSEIAGIIGAALLAFHPVFVQFTCFPMTEGVFTALFTGGLYYFLTGFTRRSFKRRVAGAILGGLSLATRVEGILFLPLALLIILMYSKEYDFRFREVPVLCVPYFLPAGLFFLRNIISIGRLSAYTAEYEATSAINARLMWQRTRLLAWNTLYDKYLFYLGSAMAVLRKRKAFFILFGWFFLFVAFHVFWYYTHPRFLTPALPAVCLLAGYFIAEGAQIVLKEFTGDGWVGRMFRRHGGLAKREKSMSSESTTLMFRIVRFCGLALFALIFVGFMFQNIRNSEKETRWQIDTMAGDMGGRGIVYAVQYLKTHGGTSQTVATTVGPYFAWEYGGPVLYTRDVPVAIPFEKADVSPPDLVRKLSKKGVRFLILTNVSGGKEALIFPGVPKDVRIELAQARVEQDEVNMLKLVKYWNEYYPGRKGSRIFVAIFEILAGR